MALTLSGQECSRYGFADTVEEACLAAEQAFEATHLFLKANTNRHEIETALRIRAVENSLYDLFGQGKLQGTIHTCIGQESLAQCLGSTYARMTLSLQIIGAMVTSSLPLEIGAD